MDCGGNLPISKGKNRGDGQNHRQHYGKKSVFQCHRSSPIEAEIAVVRSPQLSPLFVIYSSKYRMIMVATCALVATSLGDRVVSLVPEMTPFITIQ